MQKRGQATTLIVVGILIVIILAIFSYYSRILARAPAIKEELAIPQTVEQIKSLVKECLDDSVSYSTYLVISHGGSLEIKNSMEVPELGRIQVGYNKASNSINLPSQNTISNEISKSIASEVETCSDLRTSFPGLISQINPPIVSTTIQEDKVSVSLQYPIIAKKGATETRILDTFESQLKVNIPKLLKVGNDLLDTIKKDPDYLDLYFISNAPTAITFLPLEENKAVFILTDEDSLIKGIPLALVFGSVYK
ncbi:hypothetical protein HY498_03510 [Candidatus Woesearchaeota archaeon]|nr:hypothetical protein [Candidatus Woesearchaeota archaeon]